MVEIQPILRWEKAFYLPCQVNKNGQAKTPPPISNGGPLMYDVWEGQTTTTPLLGDQRCLESSGRYFPTR